MESDKELYPDDQAVEWWAYDDTVCYLVRHKWGHYCGYSRFSKRPLREQGYDGIATYVPVHGGITYAHQDEAGFVYGFDCAHSRDEYDPQCSDLDWLRGQCELMARCIKVAADFEERYLLASENEERAQVLDEFMAAADTRPNLEDNFGAMLNVLCGRL